MQYVKVLVMALVNTDAFSVAQMQSKLWMVERLERTLDEYEIREEGYRIWILAGWYGLTNLLIRTRNKIRVKEVRSYDIDPSCEGIADSVNNLWVFKAWEFKAHTADINTLEYRPSPDIVINTSIEHMSSNQWWDNIPAGTFVCLQGSNLIDTDHVNPINSSRDLLEKYPLNDLFYEGIKLFQFNDTTFNRSMIMGVK